jgi:hypothetical protein
MSINRNIVNIRNLDINKVSFVPGPTKPGRNPAINLKYDGQNMQILVPRLAFPGGVMVRTDEKTGSVTYTLMGTLSNCDSYAKERAPDGTDVQKFYNFLVDLEERIILAAVENSVKWFGKKRSEEGIREGFNRVIGTSKDKQDGEWVPNGKYPPSFKAKVPVYDNRVSTEIVDGQRNSIYATPESLTSIFTKGVEANLVVSGSIYVIAGGGFGVTWRLQTAQVFARARMTAADIFEVEEEEELPSTSQLVPIEESQVEETERPATPTDQPVQASVPAAPARKRRVAVAGGS